LSIRHGVLLKKITTKMITVVTRKNEIYVYCIKQIWCHSEGAFWSMDMNVLLKKMPLSIRGGSRKAGLSKIPYSGHDMRRCGVRKGIFIIVGVPRAGHGNSSKNDNKCGLMTQLGVVVLAPPSQKLSRGCDGKAGGILVPEKAILGGVGNRGVECSGTSDCSAMPRCRGNEPIATSNRDSRAAPNWFCGLRVTHHETSDK